MVSRLTCQHVNTKPLGTLGSLTPITFSRFQFLIVMMTLPSHLPLTDLRNTHQVRHSFVQVLANYPTIVSNNFSFLKAANLSSKKRLQCNTIGIHFTVRKFWTRNSKWEQEHFRSDSEFWKGKGIHDTKVWIQLNSIGQFNTDKINFNETIL